MKDLRLIRVKVEWAKQHIRDLEIVRKRFINSEPKPYRIDIEKNAQSGQ
jgi:hypothetical protein